MKMTRRVVYMFLMWKRWSWEARGTPQLMDRFPKDSQAWPALVGGDEHSLLVRKFTHIYTVILTNPYFTNCIRVFCCQVSIKSGYCIVLNYGHRHANASHQE